MAQILLALFNHEVPPDQLPNLFSCKDRLVQEATSTCGFRHHLHQTTRSIFKLTLSRFTVCKLKRAENPVSSPQKKQEPEVKSRGLKNKFKAWRMGQAIAEYLSRDLPYKLSSDDVFITSGCTQAIDVALAMLARPGANILLPRPGFPIYELCAAFRHLEVRHFDLLPEKGWEVDLDTIEALADQNTVAVVIINPGNPCGNVYSYQHLKKIAETAEKLKVLVIADEVYGHLVFGRNPFVPMGVFGSIVPVLTLGSLSKRWIVPGWRLGWFVTSDPSGMFRNPKVVERIKKYFDILGGPATFIQAAVPGILELTDEVFFKKTINILKQSSDICFDRLKEIPCISCPYKPEGSMAMMSNSVQNLLFPEKDFIRQEGIAEQVENGSEFKVRVFSSSSELLESLHEKWGSVKKQPYPAMYSSVYGGIILDPAMMVIPMDDHMVHRGHDRFLRSASKARIASPFPCSSLRSILIQMATASKCKKGTLRYWLSAGPGNFLLSPAGCPASAFYAVVIDEDFSQRREGVKVITSTIPMKSALFATMKNVNYLPNVLSVMEAEDQGAFASIWIDEKGYVAEGPNVNVAFISQDKELILPPFDNILSGCTALRLLQLAPKLIEQGRLKSVKTGNLTLMEAKGAAEMMYVGSTLPILPIVMWDEQPIGDGKVGELTMALSDLLWDDMVAGPGTLRIPLPYEE
uniref:Aminotransferase class I/classII large domain-containing protein n=1 Tax=Salix viminalis TaxID=40686 RepID=A0A6N2NH20_SALVM